MYLPVAYMALHCGLTFIMFDERRYSVVQFIPVCFLSVISLCLRMFYLFLLAVCVVLWALLVELNE